MSKKIISILLVVMMVVAMMPAALAGTADGKKIALVGKSAGNAFFEIAAAAFKEAGEAEGATIDVVYPEEATADAQIKVLDNLISQQPDAICISANDFNALQAKLEEAMEALTKDASLENLKAMQEYVKLGKVIRAGWSTPLMPLGGYGYRKNILDVWVTGQPYYHTGGTVFYDSDRYFEKEAKEYSISVFYWEDIDFEDFSFNSLDRPEAIRCGKKDYGVEMFRVKVENARPQNPFGIYAIQVDFETAGRTKA